MTILAIDTSSAWCSVALLFDDNRFELKHEELGSQSSQLLLPWIQTLLHTHQLSWQDVNAIAVSEGPGAFTGVRLGVGVAQGLALANNKPLVPISSLDGLALHQYFINESTWIRDAVILVAIDARMDQVYWAKYQTSKDSIPKRLGNIELSAPENIDLDGVDFIVGNALEIYPERIRSINSPLVGAKQPTPNALGIAFAAKQLGSISSGYAAADCQPLYVRDKVAQTIAERTIGKVG